MYNRLLANNMSGICLNYLSSYCLVRHRLSIRVTPLTSPVIHHGRPCYCDRLAGQRKQKEDFNNLTAYFQSYIVFNSDLMIHEGYVMLRYV